MSTLFLIILLFVSSFSGALFLANTITSNWLKKQEIKMNRSVQTAPALPKAGIYSVSAEEYYLIH